MPGLRQYGEIEFQDPWPGNVHGGRWVVKPEAGTMLMFPAWLNHFLNPFRGPGGTEFQRVQFKHNRCSIQIECGDPAA